MLHFKPQQGLDNLNFWSIDDKNSLFQPTQYIPENINEKLKITQNSLHDWSSLTVHKDQKQKLVGCLFLLNKQKQTWTTVDITHMPDALAKVKWKFCNARKVIGIIQS